MFKTQVELLYEAMEFHWNSSTRDSEKQNEQLSGGGEVGGIFPRCLNTGFNFTVYVTGQN